ncbi:NAD(P)/FAD-dependent oxidoreductase [Brachybacterium sp. EF45031]|nr:NAD(P)/FAD-dependent oxidoreductase [Brachybacterium sillae]
MVIGGGQAGISAAHHLLRLGAVPADDLAHAATPPSRPHGTPTARRHELIGPARRVILLDAEDGPGGAWRHRWPSLTMATVNRIADLPDMPLRDIPPQTPAREAVPAYFAEFEQRRALPIERPVRVLRVENEDPHAGTDSPLLVRVARPDGTPLPTIRTRALINATGTWTRPHVPFVPGIHSFRGRQMRTVDYRGPEELRGRRVAVVDAGISATGFLAELSAAGVDTVWYTRRTPVFRDGPFEPEVQGRAAVARVEQRIARGLPPESVVSVTGLRWTPELRAARDRGALQRRPMPTNIVPEGLVEADGTVTPVDVILWATGFRAALDHLAPLHLRTPGGGIRMDGTQVAADPRIHLVGYGPSASTIGANRAGRRAVRTLLRHLRQGDEQREDDPALPPTVDTLHEVPG